MADVEPMIVSMELLPLSGIAPGVAETTGLVAAGSVQRSGNALHDPDHAARYRETAAASGGAALPACQFQVGGGGGVQAGDGVGAGLIQVEPFVLLVRWSRKTGQEVKVCIPGHEEGQRDGDDTTSIHRGAQFKAKVAMEALQVTARCRRSSGPPARSPSEPGAAAGSGSAQDGLRELFAGGANRRQADHEASIHDLHAKIGELTVERDFLARGLKR